MYVLGKHTATAVVARKSHTNAEIVNLHISHTPYARRHSVYNNVIQLCDRNVIEITVQMLSGVVQSESAIIAIF